jgi:hypothetical protein
MSKPEQEDEDRRVHRRSKVVWPAQLIHGGRRFDCVILNLSAGGAKLQLGNLPERLTELRLVTDRFGEFAAEAVWRVGDRVGIRFLDPPATIAARLGGALPAVQADATDQNAAPRRRTARG